MGLPTKDGFYDRYDQDQKRSVKPNATPICWDALGLSKPLL